MKQYISNQILVGLLGMVLGCIAGPGVANGQFSQNNDKIHVDLSGYPSDMREAYRVFATKCSQCHGLDTSLKPSKSSEQWASVVRHMGAMVSAHISDQEGQTVLKFLNYYDLHRNAQAKTALAPVEGDSVSHGQQFYSEQGCDACHTISSKGGTVGPALTDIATRQSRDHLLTRMKARRAGDMMPVLPSETTDRQINDLVDFLMTLKGQHP